MLKRKEGWEKELNAFIEKVRNEPFKRGWHDCAIFVGNCVYQMTGKDFAIDFRGRYKTKEEAFVMLKEKGFDTLRDLIVGCAGQPYPNINFAKRGDVVLLNCEEGVSIGIIDMTGKFAATTGEKGLVFYPAKQWLEAWEI